MKTKQLIKHLRKLGNGEIKPINACHGICVELGSIPHDFNIYTVADFWPEHSGDISYFIPHPDSDLTPSEAYHGLNDLWDDSLYADTRREFCLWLADELEKEL